MKTKLAVFASLLALATTPALAQGWSSTLSGDYTYFSAGGSTANAVGTTALVNVPLGVSGLSVQANGDYHHLWAGGGGTLDTGNVGGGLVWTGTNGRIAANGQYFTFGPLHATTYGGGGEWWAAPDWTLAVRGGGLNVSSANGGYVGGQVIKYFSPDFALSGSINYTSIGSLHATDFGGRAEYLAWKDLSLYAGYTFTDAPGVSLHALMVGVKLYCDGDGPSLVEHQRSGPANYISTVTSGIFTF